MLTPYPYGIYGADSWMQNRNADRDPLAGGVSRPGGPAPAACGAPSTTPPTSRSTSPLPIASMRPDLVKECTAAEYLERAYGTARPTSRCREHPHGGG